MSVLFSQIHGGTVATWLSNLGQPPTLLGRAAVRTSALWQRTSLTAKFAVISSLIVLIGMLLLGQWVSLAVEDGVVNNRAADAVLYIHSMVSPHVQTLSAGTELSEHDRAALDALFGPASERHATVGFRIWTRDAIAYSDRPELARGAVKLDDERARAWSGEVVANLVAGLEDAHNGANTDFDPAQGSGEPLLEIYAPIRAAGTNRVIALAETYERVPGLLSELMWTKFGSWLVVATIGIAMFTAQLTIVSNGSLTIERQRNELQRRIADLTRTLNENLKLRHSNEAGVRAADVNERHLRRVGADLHDGPLQLISATMFRLDSLEGVLAAAEPAIVAEARQDISAIREAVITSLVELRDLAAGIMLPEIEHLSLSETIRVAIKRHQKRTGQNIDCRVIGGECELPLPLKICLYRFIQEGLNNASRHGKTCNIAIAGLCSRDGIDVAVDDDGPGFDITLLSSSPGLGLRGLRERIELLGGVLSIASTPGAGTSLKAHFDHIALKPEDYQP